MNTPEKVWKAAKWALILLVIFLAVESLKELKSIDYVGTSPTNINTINVDGTGNAASIPDVATFSFSVTETAKTVDAAQTLASTKVNAALKAIRDGGVADKDIQTQSYSINPHYEYQGGVCSTYSCPPSKSVLTGYDVSESIQVKVRGSKSASGDSYDFASAGKLFSAIGALGVQNVQGLNFSVDDPSSVNAEARTKAIVDAQFKAKELAKELGVSLVRIVSFSESNGGRYPMVYGLGSAKAMDSVSVAAPSPEVPAGEQKVTSSVTITYEIQ